MNVIKNIMFSSTRQWNCGDEFILFGVMNIFDRLLGKDSYNPILYNRNPSIRPAFGKTGFRHPLQYLQKVAFLKLKECDNSYHKRGGAFWNNSIDLAVVAGTPELLGERLKDFYAEISKSNIPLYILGAGSFPINGLDNIREGNQISKAEVITFRTESLSRSANLHGLPQAKYLPCPALLSAKIGNEKKWESQKKDIIIGLGYNICSDYTVPDIGISKDTYDFSTTLFKLIITKFKKKNIKFIAICHYIDEIPSARNFFSKYGIPVRYTFESRGYFDIYRDIDLLITSRVHGCGISASLGIPSIGISHDERGETVKGFLSEIISLSDRYDVALDKVDQTLNNLDAKHISLIKHKQTTLENYTSLLRKPLFKI